MGASDSGGEVTPGEAEGKQEGGTLGAKLRKCFKERSLGQDESLGRMIVRDTLVYSFLSCGTSGGVFKARA